MNFIRDIYENDIYDITIDDIPLNYTNTKYYTFYYSDNDNPVFICRFYFINSDIRKEMNYPKKYKYELGSIFMYDNYRGKNLSKLFLTDALNYFKHNISDEDIILWTYKDNIPANKLYHSLNFIELKKYKWMNKTNKIIYDKYKTKNIIFYIT